MYKYVLLLLFLPALLLGQKYDNSEATVLLTNFTYGSHLPAGDLKDRFGNSGSIGGDIEVIFGKSNIIISGEFQYLFGRMVKEDPLTNIRTPDGNIIGNNLIYANITLRQRGLHTGINVGKLFGIIPDNPRSGIRATVGVGLLQHKIRVQDDPSSFVPGLDNNYKKGYDNLSNGLSIKEFIGYQHMARNRLINFYAGIEFIQGFTNNRRSYNFNEMAKIDEPRFDMLMGFRLGWTLPFYVGDDGEDIFY